MSYDQAQAFVEMESKRREAVELGPQTRAPLPLIQSIAANILYNAPSAFNSQSTRVVMLVGSDHQNLWKAVANNNMYSEEREAIERNLEGAAGTFLFFEDSDVVEKMQEQFPSYKDKFPLYANHASGMLISAIWEALSLLKEYACVHHYSPDVCAQSAQVPQSWKCTGQLVFGSAQKKAMKVSHPVDDSHRFKVAKGDQ